jgi:hypothetical protein
MFALSSAEKRYFFALFSAIITTISSKIEAARLIILRCPDVGGSKDPGNAAFNIPYNSPETNKIQA